jgi:hypothetical protein
VKWVSERGEHFVACTQGRDNLSVASKRMARKVPSASSATSPTERLSRPCVQATKCSPVKWVSERGEHFVACTQGRDNLSVGEVALDADGPRPPGDTRGR